MTLHESITIKLAPPIHALVSDRAWTQDRVSSPFGGIDSAVLSRLFQQNVLDMMVAQRRLSRQFAQQLRSWQHSGFQVHCGRPVEPKDQSSLERLAGLYSTPQLRWDAAALPFTMTLRSSTAPPKVRLALWMRWTGSARVSSHLPDHHEHLRRYYGRYSNAARGAKAGGGSKGTPPNPR